MTESLEGLLRSAISAFNDPDRRDEYLNLYAPDVALHGYPGEAQGRTGAGGFYRRLWAAFPDVRVDLAEVLEKGEQVVARVRLAGLQTDDFFGAPSPGQRTEIDAIVWLRFRDREVVEEWQASGTLDLMTRLAARAAKASPRASASALAAALRWEEKHPEA